jgi:SAM-dependent methyltransferase
VSIKERIRNRVRAGLTAVGSVPALVPILFNSRVRRVLTRLPGAGSLYGDGWHRRHPFDRANGTDTSGALSAKEMGVAGDRLIVENASPYGGSQPSLVRVALDALPDVAGATFLDLGCGKGRVLLVAAERPFREVIGVDLSAELVRIARANVALMATRYPGRPPIRVEAGDASAFPLPAGDLVIFLYDPFGPPLMARLIAAIERALAEAPRAIYVVYYNPVSGPLFDASPALRRRWARMVPCAPEERGYAFEVDDALVIWQGGTAPAPRETPQQRIVVIPGRRAELVEPGAGD